MNSKINILNKKILWIDDDIHYLSAYIELCRLEGLNVIAVNNSDSAISVLKDHNDISLIISDYNRFSSKTDNYGIGVGWTFYKNYLSKHFSHIPVIFLSVASYESILEREKDLSNYHNHKWFNKVSTLPSELIRIIESYFNKNEEIYKDTLTDEQSNIIKIDFGKINELLIREFSRNPSYLYNISPRKFEELIAHLLSDLGYEIILTPQTRDGGKDLYAIQKTRIGPILSIIECKRYAPDKPVGVELVRSLYAVKVAERANIGVLFTTSYFTRDALEFKRSVGYELNLNDFNFIVDMIKQYVKI